MALPSSRGSDECVASKGDDRTFTNLSCWLKETAGWSWWLGFGFGFVYIGDGGLGGKLKDDEEGELILFDASEGVRIGGVGYASSNIAEAMV
ncbi:hypothetical protein RIF29_27980 [Crotalaria pallida]|uniref:Uncharacterized protein n=1 Tax=Crotalaria pallida TaxID=3830 RepID=A0AAN9ER38_CROPI